MKIDLTEELLEKMMPLEQDGKRYQVRLIRGAGTLCIFDKQESEIINLYDVCDMLNCKQESDIAKGIPSEQVHKLPDEVMK